MGVRLSMSSRIPTMIAYATATARCPTISGQMLKANRPQALTE